MEKSLISLEIKEQKTNTTEGLKKKITYQINKGEKEYLALM